MLISISKRCRRKNNWSSVAVVWNDNLPRMRAFHAADTKILGSLCNEDGDGNENLKKSSRFVNQNNSFARASHYLVHFFALTARLRRENA